MKLRNKSTIQAHFSEIKDPRIDRSKRHLLIDIISLTLCAVIGGAETWEDIELDGNCKYKWFKKFLKLPNGIPSHDTFNRVFARLDPEQLQKCFLNWLNSISSLMPGEIVAIDGKNKLETRYFITSLSQKAQKLSESIRGHWSIENQLHGVLDVGFNEDDSRIRKDNAPENLAIIRHIALNLLKQDKTRKGSIRNKRNRAGWDDDYLLSLLINS